MNIVRIVGTMMCFVKWIKGINKLVSYRVLCTDMSKKMVLINFMCENNKICVINAKKVKKFVIKSIHTEQKLRRICIMHCALPGLSNVPRPDRSVETINFQCK